MTVFNATARWILGLIAGLVIGIPAALAEPIGEQIINGQFGTDPGPSIDSWTVSGSGPFNGAPGVHARGSTYAANFTTGNAGYDDFFDSAFVVLGEKDGTIGGAIERGTWSISQVFELPAVFNGIAIESYALTIGFQSAFDGKDSGTEKDTFEVFLDNTLLHSEDSDPLPDCGPLSTCPNQQVENNPFSTVISVPPGTYTLLFTLTEQPGHATHTAVGIDNVSVTGEAIPLINSGTDDSSQLLTSIRYIDWWVMNGFTSEQNKNLHEAEFTGPVDAGVSSVMQVLYDFLGDTALTRIAPVFESAAIESYAFESEEGRRAIAAFTAMDGGEIISEIRLPLSSADEFPTAQAHVFSDTGHEVVSLAVSMDVGNLLLMPPSPINLADSELLVLVD